MRSASENNPDDLTARARIRDAAVSLFAERGMRGTSMKQVAADAGVSQALVSHHFGSKEGLRTACDEYVAAIIEEGKRAAFSKGPRINVLDALREQSDSRPLMRYLARMLIEGSEHADALVDGIVAATSASMEEAERTGIFKPSDRPRDLTTVLVLWSLGLLVLHDQAERLLDMSLDGPAEHQVRYVRAAMEALSGLFTDEAREQMLAAFPADGEEEEGSDE
ncbi:TetR/AcrR family transcriptional regulator [Streptomonospora wellingtoniae]|uniref:TetR family transcriptional regulator n=1 Tax=Streptomonospora wellingtoniae TaxID=3075544 RepID=A0ABU2KPS0_9ACTN|nr:TetR family transcriptional regulator [Streptomonospora sp. DSM 45055]MDT0301281.1 TetR family transcriptional regulator [Streptomonospora sp. DSM 45055]